MFWTVPLSTPVGRGFRIEVGAKSVEALGFSDPFEITTGSIGLEIIGEDVGVWCKCGLTTYGASRKYLGGWISCNSCQCWSHIHCYFGSYRSVPRGEWFCCWCRPPILDEKDGQPILVKKNFFTLLRMISETSGGYKRARAPNLVASVSSPLHTPGFVASFLASLITPDEVNILDLGCGDGELTQPVCARQGKKVTGIEKSKERLVEAKKNCPEATFVEGDLLSKKIIEDLLFKSRKVSLSLSLSLPLPLTHFSPHCNLSLQRYDLVIANPPFDLALQFLTVAFTLLRVRSDGTKGRVIL